MTYAVEMINITKQFPGIVANDDITLQVRSGEIHALLGENGAGKSTLMNILFGLYSHDSGVIRIHGKETQITDVLEANEYKIGMVHQHFKLVHNFTVLENIILGAETESACFLDMKTARKRVIELSEKYQLSIEPDKRISEITVGMQQRVEILKMLYRDNEILIFDEPTAVLLPSEIDELIHIIKGLVKEGKTVVFISHKLEEIKRLADRCTVLRRGKVVGTVDVAKTTKEQMAEMMVGRQVFLQIDKGEGFKGEARTILEVRNLSVRKRGEEKNSVDDISFSVRAGEIVCLAGVDGNGQSELVEAITGLAHSTGTVLLCGEDISRKSIRFRNTHGLSHIPEDRQRFGLVMEYSISQNAVLQEYFEKRFQRYGIAKEEAIGKYADELINKYDIRSGQGRYTASGSLSGGNQQKLILARELERSHDLVIAVQPTRGLDVGAIEQIQAQLIEQRNAGKAVLLISFELEEVLGLSDRILVIHNGRLVADSLDPKNITMQELGLYMAGAKNDV